MQSNKPAPDVSPKDLSIDPIERASTIPSRWYTDPSFLPLEMESIFKRTWQCVGHVDRLRDPGEFLRAEVGGNPVLLVRGKDQTLRAFYNVCRHRGGPIAIEPHGQCNALQCKYHGWTYLLDGSLRGVPQFDRVELFDRKDYGLVPIRLQEWDGLLFANVSAETSGDITLESLVTGIQSRITPVQLGTKKFYKRIEYEVECNWKVYIDNYLEGYHLPYVHPELCNLLDYLKYITETSEYHSLQYSPFTGKENVYGASDGQAYYYFIFPNLMLNILPGRLQTNFILPRGHRKTLVVFDYYYDDVSSPQAVKMIEDDIAYSDRVQKEDMEICLHVQRGLESDAYDRGRFSVEMEKGVYHFQSLLKNAIRRHLSMRQQPVS